MINLKERKKRKLTPYGAWIKTTAIQRGLSINELARAAGTSQPRISEIMHGATPGLIHRAAIEKALGATPPAELIS